jgi:hypothetical protein
MRHGDTCIERPAGYWRVPCRPLSPGGAMRSGPIYTVAEIERMSDMASAGHSFPEIAAAIGRPIMSVRSKCSALNIRARHKNRPPDFTKAEIRTIQGMAARGASGLEIGLKLNRTPSSVRAKAVGLGVQLRPPKRDWSVLRFLVEPTVQRALMLAARKRGLKLGTFSRRLLTAVVTHDLYDCLLNTDARIDKVGRIKREAAEAASSELAV